MTIPQRYQQKDAWPHRFTKASGEYVGDHGQVYQDMVCASCYLTYVWGKEPKPIGVCPGRNDKREYKRLGLL